MAPTTSENNSHGHSWSVSPVGKYRQESGNGGVTCGFAVFPGGIASLATLTNSPTCPQMALAARFTRLPEKLSKEGPNYLFVAVDGIWQGYFALKDEILWNPEDKRAPYSLVFDTRTWVDIKAVKTKRFRGFTYNTPAPEEIVPLK